MDAPTGLGGKVAGTMCNVGGRVREGKPPKLWSNFGHDFKTPATGAVNSIAPRIPPDPLLIQCKGQCMHMFHNHLLLPSSALWELWLFLLRVAVPAAWLDESWQRY